MISIEAREMFSRTSCWQDAESRLFLVADAGAPMIKVFDIFDDAMSTNRVLEIVLNRKRNFNHAQRNVQVVKCWRLKGCL